MISIFAKPAFLNINPSQPFDINRKPFRGGQLMRVSSMIRGNQIAKQIGAKLNPKKGYKNDICIYVKPHVQKNFDFKFEGKPYLDIIDGHNLGQLAIKHPKVTVIVCSKTDYKTMSNIIPNKIVFIPQHHCNFNNIKRIRKEIKTIGVIGTRGAFPHLPEGLKIKLKIRGMELLTYSRFFKRQDIIDFYMKTDIQIVWRPYKKLLSNPLKIVNAASFGIPTVALDEPVFKEMSGCYIPVKSLKELLKAIDDLKKHDDLYDLCSHTGYLKAENYHIEKVGELYKELK